MLSKRFNAKEARTVATQSECVLDQIDKRITEAVVEGLTECYVDITKQGSTDYNDIGYRWRAAEDYFTQHYKSRGFQVKDIGRQLFITW